ncbi:MAG: hypothetical protein Q6352_001645 [Candidatus Freyrarchaeum guaymaensis]|nr:hypothetical protein [Candidatus Sigynarchaeota archaeon]
MSKFPSTSSHQICKIILTYLTIKKLSIKTLLPTHNIIDKKVYKEAIVKGMEKRNPEAFLPEYTKKQKILEVVVDISKDIGYFVGEGEAGTYTLSVEKNAIAVTSDRVAYKKDV